ncbi:excinuclease ABC subunit UvrB [Patescibacteria group bacterium]
MFKLHSKFKPTGDQPEAIEKLAQNILSEAKHNVLLGVTGSGKTMTMASAIEKVQKPTLIISPNKTLCAQLYQEFKEFFPENAVHYFVSYYDYYQPEAYLPSTDTYIEKDAKINEEIDRLRHATTQDLLSRKDIVVLASVSCIYNIGSPESYQKVSLQIKPGQKIKRKDFLLHLTSLQYHRNDVGFKPGTFRVRGETIEIYTVTGKEIIRIEFQGDKIEKVEKKIIFGKRFETSGFKEALQLQLYPAQFWATPQDKLHISLENIRLEMQERIKALKKKKKLLEAQRIEQRTNYDLEMLQETGYCHGVENYSRHLEFRKPKDPPYTLIDYFNKDFLLFIDESHLTISQLRAMSVQDRARKETLIDHGFRLPSAVDNRPLTFEEFDKKISQAVYVSATPNQYEKEKAGKKYLVEQLVRPTGLIEPSIEIKPTEDQVQNIIKEIQKRIQRKERVLVLTLTKRLSEDLSDFLEEKGIKTKWLHSEVKTLERPEILKDLRTGKYDVLVGVNLLREGLDLPEVSLVAILDADKEGFLRSEVTLIQTMGRAARHLKGHVILYADTITHSIKKAIDEIDRRREIQVTYNKEHNISPKAVEKEIREWQFTSTKTPEDLLSLAELKDVREIEKEMKRSADQLNFEQAAKLRDLIKKLKAK